jgi:hypothetical protein
MTLPEAQHKLKLARKRQKALQFYINTLKAAILKHGVNPDPRLNGLKKRNERIYKMYLKGMKFTAIATHFGLSAARISSICYRLAVAKAKRPVKSH